MRGRRAGFRHVKMRPHLAAPSQRAHTASQPMHLHKMDVGERTAVQLARAQVAHTAAVNAMSAPSEVPQDAVLDMSGIAMDPFTNTPMRGAAAHELHRRKTEITNLNHRRASLRIKEATQRAEAVETTRRALAHATTHAEVARRHVETQSTVTRRVTAAETLETQRAHALGMPYADHADHGLVADLRDALDTMGMTEEDRGAVKGVLMKLNQTLHTMSKDAGLTDKLVDTKALVNPRRFFAMSNAAHTMLMGTTVGDGASAATAAGAGASADADANADEFEAMAAGMGTVSMDNIRSMIRTYRSTVVRQRRHAHPGTIMPICTLRPPMGLSKPRVSGFTAEIPNDTSNDFVAMHPHNSTGMTMMWAIKSGFSAGMEASAGALLRQKLEKHPGLGQRLNVASLLRSEGIRNVTSGKTVLNPEKLSVILCNWNPSHNMFARDIEKSSVNSTGMMTPSQLAAAEESRYVVMVHIPQDTKPGQMYDTLLRINKNKDDHTVQWLESARTLNPDGAVEQGAKVHVMSYADALSERFFRVHQTLQTALGHQMADFLQSNTGKGDLQLELMGTSRTPLGVVHTDGWTQFATTAAAGAFDASGGARVKAVYCSNTIPLVEGHGPVPVFKGPGRGCHVLSSAVRDALGGANSKEDTEIVPASAGRLHAPKDSLFLMNRDDPAWVAKMQASITKAHNIHFVQGSRAADDLSRELLCYTPDDTPESPAYNGRHDLDAALQKYAGRHAATSALHIATALL